MAWSESLLDCSFRGFILDIMNVEDGGEHALSEHTYPYVDGADLEDLGLEGRPVSIDAKFWDGMSLLRRGSSAKVSGYESRLQEFIELLNKRGAGELVHPIYGSMLVQVVRYRVRHEADEVDQCVVHVDFKETTGGDKPFFDRKLPSQKTDLISYQGGIARTALGNALGNVIDALRNSSALAAFNNLRQGMLGPVLATINEVRGVLLSGSDVLSSPRAWANDISSIVDGILDLKDFGTKLLSDWKSVGSLLGLFDVFSSSGSNSSNSAPAQIRAGTTPSEAQSVAAVQAHLAASTAIGVANAAALVLAAEADPQHGATLSPPEIESVVNEARGRIEDAIAAIRAIYPLETARSIVEPMKDQALALQEAARAIIEARPPLLERVVEMPGNLRLMAHRWYGDHTRATELARLNPELRQPNNLQFGDVLNAYAV